MGSIWPDWSWKPDEKTLAALSRGRQKLRGPQQQSKETEMASKKKTKSKAPAKAKKKLDGKALAAKRKPRDSVAQFIKDELNAGKTDVGKIIERAKADFPKANPTPGYVRFIAKQIGKAKQVESTRGKGEKKAKPAKKSKPAKPAASTKKTETPSTDVSPDPAS